MSVGYGKPRVLVIEDDFPIAWDLASILAPLGFTVWAVAPTEEEAVQAALRAHPDLIMADVSSRKGHAISAGGTIEAASDKRCFYVYASAAELVSPVPSAVRVDQPFHKRAICEAIQQVLGDDSVPAISGAAIKASSRPCGVAT
jgi:two-component system, response regulator PdtaR